MGKKKILIIIIAALLSVAGLLFACINFYLQATKLHAELSQTKAFLERSNEEISRVKEEKGKISQEKEKLQADSISYLGFNTKLQEEQAKLKKEVGESNKSIQKKEDELQKVKLALDQIRNHADKEDSQLKDKLSKERAVLIKDVKALEAILTKERGFYHYNLGVSFTKAKLFDEAINAYEKSLEFDPDNPEAHYNLGLLFANVKGQPEEAVVHYRKYLQLKPDAEDKDEVEAWIAKLK